MPTALPDQLQQLLPRVAYTAPDWFAREQQELFGRSWTFAGTIHDFPDEGDYRTVQAGPYGLMVLKDAEGTLRGFHNVCRHRGTELLEGCGNAGRTVVCPYHHWTYSLDGRLRGAPGRSDCFPDLDVANIRLHSAAIGILNDLVFVHPDPDPAESFDHWCDRLADVPWPHQIGPGGLQEGSEELVYELECNWKVFAENALDGYHLAYLHKNTLGGPTYDKNVWEAFGRHLVWWSTERDGVKHRIPKMVEEATKAAPSAHRPAEIGYGGVYYLFPTLLVVPHPWGFSCSVMEPVDAGKTLLRVRNWSPKSWLSYSYGAKDVPGYDPVSGRIKSSHWTQHPLETGDFQTEDVWICEKMQRGLTSPKQSVSALAKGAGGEAAISHFQACLLDMMDAGQAHAAQ